jgi:hypothetical protein
MTKKLKTFVVDFALYGDVEVKAKNREEAIKKASELDDKEILEGIQNTHYGEQYADEI